MKTPFYFSLYEGENVAGRTVNRMFPSYLSLLRKEGLRENYPLIKVFHVFRPAGAFICL